MAIASVSCGSSVLASGTVAAVTISITDSASGDDSSLELLYVVNVSDLAIASETSIVIAARFTLFDTVFLLDEEVSIFAKMCVNDSGLGSESLFKKYVKFVSDLGLATDALNIFVSLLVQDSLVGVDSPFLLSKSIPFTETGSGSDSLSINVFLMLEELVSSLEGIDIYVNFSLDDSSLASDDILAMIDRNVSDTALFSDSVAVDWFYFVDDFGSVIDKLVVEKIDILTGLYELLPHKFRREP